MSHAGFDGVTKESDCLGAATFHQFVLSCIEKGLGAFFALSCWVAVRCLIDGCLNGRLIQKRGDNRTGPLFAGEQYSVRGEFALSIATRTNLCEEKPDNGVWIPRL